MFILLAHNTSPIDGTFNDYDSDAEVFNPLYYKLAFKSEPLEDTSTCLNMCSNNGQCKYDLVKSSLPYCECFTDFAGADCSLIVKEFSIGDEPQTV